MCIFTIIIYLLKSKLLSILILSVAETKYNTCLSNCNNSSVNVTRNSECVKKRSVFIRRDSIVPCGRSDFSEMNCKRMGCSWQSHLLDRAAPPCFCDDATGYVVVGGVRRKGAKYKIRLRRQGATDIFGMSVHQYMNVEVDMYASKALRIYFYPDRKVYEVPKEALTINKPIASSRNDRKKHNITFVGEDQVLYQCTTAIEINQHYGVKFTKIPYFGIQVIRRETGAVIFNTSLPGLTFSNQFLQISTKLPTSHVYGFGRNGHDSFKHDMNWRVWAIFVRANKSTEDWNYYGAHPVYMNLENDGKANMVFLKNSNAMDIILQPNPYPAITHRPIGGVLDFYIFLGDSPGDALQQYIQAIGYPLMPPYWSMGFHLSKWEYDGLSHADTLVERTNQANIPLESQWLDIEYMDNWFIFTYSKDNFGDLSSYAEKLHRNGQKLVVTVNPGIGSNMTPYNDVKSRRFGYQIYEDGLLHDVFIKDANGSILQGLLWPGSVAFADFTNMNRTGPWWEHYIRYFYNEENVKFDGLWLDKNEPDNTRKYSLEACTDNQWDNPPYLPNVLDGGHKGGCLYGRTVCMNSQLYLGRHYDIHNLYSHSMAIVTNRALQNIFPTKRPFLITRSTYPGTAKHAITWLGDNESTWLEMHKSIIGMLEYGLFGFSMVGADICGLDKNTDYEMCLRWSQLGAFYPLSRNHNRRNLTDHDPVVWGAKFVRITRRALLIRYRILPYMYTLLHHAHVYGKTLARPLMFEYPKDKKTWNIDRQFLLGPAFMVSPVLKQGHRTVKAYFPKDMWYSYYDGIPVRHTAKYQTLQAPLDIINLHLRGGFIIPIQEPANTTVYSRRKPMGLLISFAADNNSKGDLFWDDGESKDTYENGKYLYVKFSAYKGQYLDINVIHNNYPEAANLVFGSIDFYGMPGVPTDLHVNNRRINTRHIHQSNKIVRFTNLRLKITKSHNLQWSFSNHRQNGISSTDNQYRKAFS